MGFDMDEHLYNAIGTTEKSVSPAIFKENAKQLTIIFNLLSIYLMQKIKNMIKY